MALSANTVWEVRTGGNDTNGGGFVTGAAGNDYSLQDSKNTVGSDISTTDAVANGTTTLTSATANFGTTIVGNIIYLQGGTGGLTAVWRQVTARASTTSITLDAAVAAGTGITMNIGGALASPAVPYASLVAGNLVFIKAGTYSVTSTSTNVANGCISVPASARTVGYSTTRTFANTDTRPIIQVNVASATLTTGATGFYKNLELDGNSQATSNFSASGAFFIDCLIKNFTAATTACHLVRCEVTGCSATMLPVAGHASFCTFHGNTATPILGACNNVISYGNTGATTDGFGGGTTNPYVNCTAYQNGRAGFNPSGTAPYVYINCLSESNVGNGFDRTAAAVVNMAFINCATFGNAAAFGANISSAQQIGSIALTGSGMTNPAAGDFSLNNTTGAGASLRGLSYPATFLPATTSQYVDIGAVQHQDSGGSVTPVSTPAVNLNAKTLSGFTSLGTVTVGTTPITLESAFPGISISAKTAATVQFCTHEANSASGIIYIGDLTMLSATQAIASLLGPNVVFKLENMGALNTVPLGNIKLLANAAGQQVRISVLVS